MPAVHVRLRCLNFPHWPKVNSKFNSFTEQWAENKEALMGAEIWKESKRAQRLNEGLCVSRILTETPSLSESSFFSPLDSTAHLSLFSRQLGYSPNLGWFGTTRPSSWGLSSMSTLRSCNVCLCLSVCEVRQVDHVFLFLKHFWDTFWNFPAL